MDHLNVVDQTGNGVQHVHWIAAIEWLAQLLQCVQVLQVVAGFVGCIRDLSV